MKRILFATRINTSGNTRKNKTLTQEVIKFVMRRISFAIIRISFAIIRISFATRMNTPDNTHSKTITQKEISHARKNMLANTCKNGHVRIKHLRRKRPDQAKNNYVIKKFVRSV